MSEGKPLVVVRELTKSFLHMGRPLEVLKGIDLEIYEGEVVAIVGKSGAGKSTLLQCIGTLDMASSGVIWLAGQYLVGLSRADLAANRNKLIGFVFQFHHLLPEFTALENVMMPGLIQGLPRPEIEKRATELLEDVGLGHRLTHRPGELSGGEQQRVALARALVLEPKLILADEPTGNLDTATSEAIHKLFFDINKKHGTTIVVVTHNTKLAESMPRIIRMLDGKIFEDTSDRDELFALDKDVLERSRALEKVVYAGFWKRAGARVFDLLLLNILGILTIGAVVFMRAGMPFADALVATSLLVIFAPLFSPLHIATIVFGGNTFALLAQGLGEWGSGGLSPGKMLFGLRVRDEGLYRPTFGSAMGRNLLVTIDGLFVGLVAYLGIKSSLLHQRFGDGLAQTVVVEKRTLPSGSDISAWRAFAFSIGAAIALNALFTLGLLAWAF